MAHLVVGLDRDERRHLARLAPGPEHVADTLVGRALEEPVLGPGVVVDLAQVRASAVGQDHGHERVRNVEFPCDLHRGHERGAARASGQDALGHRQAARHEEGLAVGDGDPAVDDPGVERLRPEVLADALDEVGPDVLLAARVDRADRVGADDDHARVALLEVAPGAGDRAAGAHAGDELRGSAGGLLPDLRARSTRGGPPDWRRWSTGWAGTRRGYRPPGARRHGSTTRASRGAFVGATTTSAPYARRRSILSRDILSGITATTR